MGRNGEDGEIREKIFKIGVVRCRKEDARIFDKRGSTEGVIKRKSRKEGVEV